MSGESSEVSLLLITANVGTLFEQPDQLLKPWLDQFCQKLSTEQPAFVALHCQEVGGKTFITGMQHVHKFVDVLLTAPELAEYSRIRGFFDEDFATKAEFTALGSVYFVHSRVSDAAMWDFSGCRFHPIADKEIQHDSLRQDTFHKKLKYPPDFFPQFPWSRKGHIVTRWRIQNRVVDMVNVHLFHDASNLESVEQSPSIYVGNRGRALRHTLQKLQDLGLPEAPLFIFGDFNFRIDLHDIVHDFLPSTEARPVKADDETTTAMEYYQAGEDTPALQLEKKRFVLRDCLTQDGLLAQWRKYDKESRSFPQLFEQHISFPPSYPFSEDEGVTQEYMKTRPPSWCDRVLYNAAGKELVQSSTADYFLLGDTAEMGDHKPVCLSVVSHPTSTSQPEKTAPQATTAEHANNNKNNNNSAGGADSAGSTIEPSAKRVWLCMSCFTACCD